ncbi:MAG TPA: glucoamylase family protein, partial [Candidatus Acidoferrales bacterium]|nr:glucoamylase family protein [Candidatus Acidoferrales bacterium]
LTDWYDTDVIGIDLGITMLMAENARTGFVWETFMRNPAAQRGMKRAGFVPNAHPSPPPVSKA